MEQTLDEAMSEVYDKYEAEQAEETVENQADEVESQESEEEQPEQALEVEAKQDEPEAESIVYPDGFNKQERALFEQFSPEAQQAMIEYGKRQTSGYTKANQELVNVKREYNTVKSKLETIAQRNNIAIEQVLDQVNAMDHALRNPATAKQLILDLARRANIDLTAPSDPRIEALEANIAQRDIREQQQREAAEQRQRMAEQEENASMEQIVMGFLSNPETPHFAEVQQEVASVLPLIQQRNPGATPEALLQAAYEQALRLRPELEQRDIEAEVQKRLDAEKRKNAKRNNIKTTNFAQGSSGKGKQTMDEAMGAVYDRLMGA